MSLQHTILLTGATGTIGKLLLQFLSAKHIESSSSTLNVKILVRNIEKAKELLGKYESPNMKLSFIEGDLNQLQNLNDKETVFSSVEKLFILTLDSPEKSD